MYIPAYVPRGYNVTLIEHVDGKPVSTPVPHEKLIETMTIGKPEEKPFKFLGLVSEARIAINLSMNLAVFNSYVKQSNPQRTFVCQALSFISMKKNKSGVYEGAKIEIEPEEFKVSGHMLFLDKNFNTPMIASLRNRTLWSLAIKVNEIWIRDIAIDVVVFPSFAKMQKFCEQKEFDIKNPLLQLSPFWYTPAKSGTRDKADVNELKRTREAFPQENIETQKNSQRIFLGHVSDKHQVTLWMINSKSSLFPHQEVIEQLTVGKVDEEPFPGHCLVSNRMMRITFAINLRSLKNYAGHALQKMEQAVKKLVFFQQEHLGNDVITRTRPLSVKPAFIEIKEEKLHFVTVFRLQTTASSLKSTSLWKVAIQVYGIWIIDMGADFAVFDSFAQMERYCYEQKLDDDNALFNLAPFWYNEGMREKYFSERKTHKKSKNQIKDALKLDGGSVKKPCNKMDLYCDEDFSTIEENLSGKGFFSTSFEETRKQDLDRAENKRARNVGQMEHKTEPAALNDSAPEPMLWEKTALEPLFPELVAILEGGTTFY